MLDNGEKRLNILLEEADPRWWHPEKEIPLNATIQLPADIPEGKYTISLWLPDESDYLQDKSAFSIRFANEGVWDEQKGYNVLGEIEIDSGTL